MASSALGTALVAGGVVETEVVAAGIVVSGLRAPRPIERTSSATASANARGRAEGMTSASETSRSVAAVSAAACAETCTRSESATQGSISIRTCSEPSSAGSCSPASASVQQSRLLPASSTRSESRKRTSENVSDLQTGGDMTTDCACAGAPDEANADAVNPPRATASRTATAARTFIASEANLEQLARDGPREIHPGRHWPRAGQPGCRHCACRLRPNVQARPRAGCEECRGPELCG